MQKMHPQSWMSMPKTWKGMHAHILQKNTPRNNGITNVHVAHSVGQSAMGIVMISQVSPCEDVSGLMEGVHYLYCTGAEYIVHSPLDVIQC